MWGIEKADIRNIYGWDLGKAPVKRAVIVVDLSKPGTKMMNPEPCGELKRRISATIYGWDCPLLTFIYPGFDSDSSRSNVWGRRPLNVL